MQKLLLNQLFILSCLSFSLYAQIASSTGTSKTVCTLTLNSSDEREVFRKNLEPLGYSFVELTEGLNTLDANWFDKSCDRKVQCDILVVSGHFAGKFFGSSGFNLPIEKLETKTCDTACDGILRSPREVFLFGCNTLAGKEKDERTPEEYFQNLLQDGLSRSQAEASVGFRYSPLGSTFSERMRRVFPSTPRIYGFYSRAPLGKNVKDLLGKYFSAAKNYYQNFDKQINTSINTTLKKTLKVTSITQTDGNTDGASPVCYLTSDKVSNVDKLTWINKELETGNFLRSVFGIKLALAKIKKDQTANSEQQRALWDKIRLNSVAKDIALKITTKPIEYLRTIQVDIIKMSQELGWFSDTQYDSKINQFVWGDLHQEFTDEQRNFICAVETQVEVPDYVPDSLFGNTSFLSTLPCTKPQRTETHNKILAGLHSKDWMVRYMAVYALTELKIHSELALNEMILTLKTDANATVRVMSANYFLRNVVREPRALEALRLSANSDSEDYVRKSALEIWQFLSNGSN